MDYALEIRGARKAYPGFRLQDVSLALPRGYIMGLIGPNGAGKTTLIKIILNLVRADSGEIRIFGLDHRRGEIEAKSRIGFVHDTPPFFEHLTLARVRDTVAPFYETWDEPRFRALLEEFKLPLRQRLSRLSRGMKMKFSLAVALSHRADLLVLDEPTTGLDPVFRRELLTKLQAFLQDGGRSVLFSTHITADLERIADYVTFLDRGTVVFSAPTDEILESWALVKGGRELLAEEHRGLFRGARSGEFGVQALTSDASEARRRFGGAAAIERATLEDIMFFVTRRDGHA